jgi:ureidoacrylate peracid hydrolase
MATTQGAEIGKSALIVVDMQNDFVHPEGALAYRARENPEAGLDIPFITGAIPHAKQLISAFREAGRPVIYVAHVVKPDYSDAQFPYWRLARPSGNRTFIVENTWGAEVVDGLKPRDGEHLIVKKGFGGFSNTPLDTILRNLHVTTCVVAGVMTGICVSSTVRGGVEHNYRMIVAANAVADVFREAHEAELNILARVFADVKMVSDVIAMFGDSTGNDRLV